MTKEEAIKQLKYCKSIHNGSFGSALKLAIKALEREPCIQEKQANADKIDAVYIDGFKAGYSQARFDLEREPCEDVISRADARHLIAETNRKDLGGMSTKTFKILYDGIDALPPVTPQSKTGHWIVDDFTGLIKCDICGNDAYMDTTSCEQCKSKFCPSCGVRMESE